MIPATRPAPTPTRSLDARARRSERASSRRRLVRAVAAARSDRAADDGDKLIDRPSSSRRDVLVRGFTSALILPRSRAALADDLFCGYYSQNSAVVPQWARETPWSEGYVDTSAAVGLEGAKTFVRILGDQKKAEGAGLTPVLCLHGGPGLGFKYMDGLEVLASEKREVASYDQIGCARSPYVSDPKTKKTQNQTAAAALPPPPGTYTPALFADELAEVRRATGLGRVHVVAHGWGGMLALDHVLGGNGVDRAAPRGSNVAVHRVAHPRLGSPVVRPVDRRQARGLRQMPGEYAQVLLDGDEGGAGGGNLSDAGRKLYAAALDEWTQRCSSAREPRARATGG